MTAALQRFGVYGEFIPHGRFARTSATQGTLEACEHDDDGGRLEDATAPERTATGARYLPLLRRVCFSTGESGAVTPDTEDIAWTATGSDRPFDALDERRDDEHKIQEQILHLRSMTNVPLSGLLADRLDVLLQTIKEETPEEFNMSSDSLRRFIEFLRSEPSLKFPDIVLTASGNIWSEWRVSPREDFTAEFLPDGDVRFVIFAPDPRHSDKTVRLAGLCSFDTLIDAAEPLGVLRWAAE